MTAEEQDANEAAAAGDASAPEPAATEGSEPAVPADGEEQAEEQAAEEVEQDLEELQDPAVEAAQMRELAQRTQADFENFRKRARQNEQLAGDRGVAKLARELIGALDNFDHALAALAERPEGDPVHEVARGFGLIRDELVAGLARCGVEVDRPAEGDRFDPQFHEAIAHVPSEELEAGAILAVHQPGYRLGDMVIRAARVSVAGG
ncbi:MAG: nucleotide exchange factor GrpE [Actinomycetes bacterium]